MLCSWGLVTRPIRVSRLAWIKAEVSSSGALILFNPPVGWLFAGPLAFSSLEYRLDILARVQNSVLEGSMGRVVVAVRGKRSRGDSVQWTPISCVTSP